MKILYIKQEDKECSEFWFNHYDCRHGDEKHNLSKEQSYPINYFVQKEKEGDHREDPLHQCFTNANNNIKLENENDNNNNVKKGNNITNDHQKRNKIKIKKDEKNDYHVIIKENKEDLKLYKNNNNTESKKTKIISNYLNIDEELIKKIIINLKDHY